jgi:aspartate racemase
MAALYEAFVRGADSPLPELPIQYADFARWQREWLQGDVLESQLTYWKQSLTGHASVLELPTDYARASAKSLRAEVETFELSQSLSDALKQLSRRESATLYMTLLTAFKTLLYWHTGEEDILLATPVSGRTQMGTEKLIGCFINTLALRTVVNGALSFRELLARVREVSLGAYAHQDLPFEKLVEELQPERDANRPPLFRLMFVMQNAAPEEVLIQGLSFKLAQADNGFMQFDFILSMTEEAGVLVGAMGYRCDLFHRSTITRLASHLKTLLQSIVADPDEKLANLHILTESERGGSNASDFPETGMSQMEFENLILEINEETD